MASSASTQVREGWQELPLIECTSDRQISYGVVQPGFPVTDGVPIVRVNNLVNGRIITNDAMRIAPEIDYSHRRTKLHGGEIVLSLVGTTGSVAIVPDKLKGWNVARAIAVIRPDEKIVSV
jgi:type I restriction enzyme S subunit